MQIFRWNSSKQKLKLTETVTVGFLLDNIAWSGNVVYNHEPTDSGSGFTCKDLLRAGVRLDGLKGSSIGQLLESE